MYNIFNYVFNYVNVWDINNIFSFSSSSTFWVIFALWYQRIHTIHAPTGLVSFPWPVSGSRPSCLSSIWCTSLKSFTWCRGSKWWVFFYICFLVVMGVTRGKKITSDSLLHLRFSTPTIITILDVKLQKLKHSKPSTTPI